MMPGPSVLLVASLLIVRFNFRQELRLSRREAPLPPKQIILKFKLQNLSLSFFTLPLTFQFVGQPLNFL